MGRDLKGDERRWLQSEFGQTGHTSHEVSHDNGWHSKIRSHVSIYGIEIVYRSTLQKQKHGQRCVTSGDKYI